jgi:hypothetical protein
MRASPLAEAHVLHAGCGLRRNAPRSAAVAAPHACAPALLPASWPRQLALPPLQKRRPLRHVLASSPRAASARQPLSSAGRAAAFTGAYISLAGACLLAAPLRTLSLLFACDGITPAWVRVFGVLCLTFGSYYVGAASLEARGAPAPVAFYRATVAGRVALCAAFTALVLGGGFPQPALLVVRAPAHARVYTRGCVVLRVCLTACALCAQLGAVNAAGAAAMHFALRRDTAAAAATLQQ